MEGLYWNRNWSWTSYYFGELSILWLFILIGRYGLRDYDVPKRRKLPHIGLLFGIEKIILCWKFLKQLTIKYEFNIFKHLFSDIPFRDTIRAPTDVMTPPWMAFICSFYRHYCVPGDHKKSLWLDTRCLQNPQRDITAEQAAGKQFEVLPNYTFTAPVRIIDFKIGNLL